MERGSAGQLLAVNTFVWVTTALYAPFIGAYYAEQGITPFQVGVLTAIGPVVSTLIQPLWAYISDRLGKRRRVLMIVTIGSGLTILTYLLHVSFHAFVAATLCFTVFQTSILPLADALVTQEAARQKANFAKIRMGGTTGYAITALVLGNFLKARPELIFVLGSCGFFLLTFFLRLLPEDKTRQSVEIKKQKFGGEIFKTKQIYLVLLLAFVMQLGLSFTGTFYSVYVMSLGYGQFIVGLSSCISAMSELPVLLFADRLVKKFGAVRLLEFSVFMMATRRNFSTTAGILAVSHMIPFSHSSSTSMISTASGFIARILAINLSFWRLASSMLRKLLLVGATPSTTFCLYILNPPFIKFYTGINVRIVNNTSFHKMLCGFQIRNTGPSPNSGTFDS